ncbi:acyl-CoA thioester hydrolase [Chitinophaga sp. YR573]|uniref:acyl-CoA thioesterase n=1 Tax=Chitinophaga sp. YR573 TaxID=1881040 RepID=UPI0008C05622|nr:acyl-CoA thioesterase [Chitinophaga sp. YR573]SEW00705.1 acyl-CoA thioester hydrolase [Chitinophaga sp. YR573]
MPKILKYYKHLFPIKVRFSDLDIVGHLNNSKYQTYLEESRIAYFQDVFNQDKTSLNFNSVLSRITIDFIKPIEFGDDITIYSRLFNVDARSFEVHNLFVRREKDKTEIVAKAHSLMAAFDFHSKMPTTYPEEYCEIVRSFEETGEIPSSGDSFP